MEDRSIAKLALWVATLVDRENVLSSVTTLGLYFLRIIDDAEDDDSPGGMCAFFAAHLVSLCSVLLSFKLSGQALDVFRESVIIDVKHPFQEFKNGQLHQISMDDVSTFDTAKACTSPKSGPNSSSLRDRPSAPSCPKRGSLSWRLFVRDFTTWAEGRKFRRWRMDEGR